MAAFPIERRDPLAAVLRLGTFLAGMADTRATAVAEVIDQDAHHLLELGQGRLVRVRLVGAPPVEHEAGIHEALRWLFSRPRPAARLRGDLPGGLAGPVSIRAAVFDALRGRTDLFDPLEIVRRRPGLQVGLTERQRAEIGALGLDLAERRFLAGLSRPTPLALVLWKRGLPPARAAALIVALNVIGLWREEWVPGDLPRAGRPLSLGEQVALSRLGLPPAAGAEEVERAFRHLALIAHPDRTAGLPATLRAELEAGFADLGGARETLSRRKPVGLRAVRDPGVRGGDDWIDLSRTALEAAATGELRRGRAYALKALAAGAPPVAAIRMRAIVSADAVS